ncbi:MAG: ATPase [Planctomycetes bacterium]|nr:ATPase [Planctomycetota bacterium]
MWIIRYIARLFSKLYRTPEGMIVGSFGAISLIGAGLLSLPAASARGAGFLDALFTATSAVCVTGLVTLDTGTDFTLFGQIVILLLIQTGGLGVMTFAALLFKSLGKKLSLHSHLAVKDTLFQEEIATNFNRMFWRLFRIMIVVELISAAVIFVGLPKDDGMAFAAYSAVFHAVSAFCNAGFSLYPDSLTGVRHLWLVMLPVMFLIVVGGLGHVVLQECWRFFARLFRLPSRAVRAIDYHESFSYHAKLVLGSSALLVIVGAASIFALEYGSSKDHLGDQIGGAIFQSVTTRTAGFNTVDVGAMHPASIFIMTMLMLIGGSPGSCAGGIKTTSFIIWLAYIRSLMVEKEDVEIFGCRIDPEIVTRTNLLVSLAVVFNITGVIVLLVGENDSGFTFLQILFEQVSAFATVGLSTGITAKLSSFSKVWIIVTMFVGRLGPLTLVLYAFGGTRSRIRYPQGKVLIG